MNTRRILGQVDDGLEVLFDSRVVRRLEEVVERWSVWGVCSDQACMRDCVGVLDCIEESSCLIYVARGILVAMVGVDGYKAKSLSLWSPRGS